MSHIGAERWMQYVKDELPPAERERCEEHLLQCDMCLAVYMECLERSEGSAGAF
ncbi:zf-HC2 domain-containing protein [Paenibacillus sp. P26]|nr:zf-HC2 domain-containing protein [Paenibacillus sp. P26]